MALHLKRVHESACTVAIDTYRVRGYIAWVRLPVAALLLCWNMLLIILIEDTLVIKSFIIAWPTDLRQFVVVRVHCVVSKIWLDQSRVLVVDASI